MSVEVTPESSSSEATILVKPDLKQKGLLVPAFPPLAKKAILKGTEWSPAEDD